MIVISRLSRRTLKCPAEEKCPLKRTESSLILLVSLLKQAFLHCRMALAAGKPVFSFFWKLATGNWKPLCAFAPLHLCVNLFTLC